MTAWGAGDYPLMARHFEPAALAAVEVAAIKPGDRVLDVATGTGNAALLAAERGGQVTGVDFEPALLRVAEQRAQNARRDVRWLHGDLEALPVPDESADVVISVLGVMYSRTTWRPRVSLVGQLRRERESCSLRGCRAV
ncbi:MAG: class I SAM-dependent methyltransferase [Acidimicrobiales bacterium]